MTKHGVTAAVSPSLVKKLDGRDDTIEVRDFEKSDKFQYESFFAGEIEKKKLDHSYRVFKKVMRDAEKFPEAKEFTRFPKDITVWCSNDYLGMSAHPKVTGAVHQAVSNYGVGAG